MSQAGTALFVSSETSVSGGREAVGLSVSRGLDALNHKINLFAKLMTGQKLA